MYYYYKNSTHAVPMLLLLLFSLTVMLQFQAKTLALPGPSCPKHCGDFEIQYPFGVGDGCAMKGFELSCNNTKDGRSFLTIFGIIPVRNILLLDGQVRIMKHISSMFYNRSSKNIEYSIWGTDLSNTPFIYSGESNRFTVIGVNTLAYMLDNTHLIGCVSQSSPNDTNHKAQDGKCDGAGCCQVALPSYMNDDSVSFSSSYNTTDYYTNRSTTDRAEYRGYAVVMETDAFKFNTTYLNTTTFLDEHEDNRVPAILNWVVGNETCDVARTKTDSYACLSTKSMCVNSSSQLGYRCNCKEGYQGNPYLPDGCYDVDECAAKPPPCTGCKNTPGAYSCPKPSNDVVTQKKSLNAVALAVGLSIGVVALVAIAIACTCLIHERKKLKKIKLKYFNQHGGRLLQDEIRLQHGTSFTIFTEAALIDATDKFDDSNILGRGGHGTVYKGTLKEGSLIAVKRCVSMASEQQKKEFGKEMLILSQINHKNIVKLLGCCLEVEVPMLVYEFIPNGTLFQFIHGSSGSRYIPLSTRLHIALESATALAYLHSWASPPILHGDVKSSNILLDENYAAKVSDFGASILAPTDESQFVTLVQGTCGYLDPEYMQTSKLTDKSDIYSFGVVLLELLTGKKAFDFNRPENERSLVERFLCAMKEGRLMDIIDDGIKNENDMGLLEEVAELASICLEIIGERRPAMRDVADKLDRLCKVMQHPLVPAQHHHPEEMESLLEESSMASLEMVSTRNFSMEKSIVKGMLESGR